MIRSMTGFGRAQAEAGARLITAEIRSLNGKQLDLSIRIPPVLRSKEHEIRAMAAAAVIRGKADLYISLDVKDEKDPPLIHVKTAKRYFLELKKLAASLGEKQENLLGLALQIPGVFAPSPESGEEISEKDWTKAKKVIQSALVEFQKFRLAEGKSAEKDLKEKVGKIVGLLKRVEDADKSRLSKKRDDLALRLKELMNGKSLDQNRMEQEMIYYLEKLDINEEKVRLKTHCNYFLDTFSEEEQGRKLGFISQEIGREINTLGAKAADAPIQKMVVQMKDELEKIKEQLLNIL